MPLQDPGELAGAGEGETGSQAGPGTPAEPTAAGYRQGGLAVRLSAPKLGPETASQHPSATRSQYPSTLFAYGHTTLSTPDLVRSRKLSRVGPGQYLDGRPPGNTRCCKLLFVKYRHIRGDKTIFITENSMLHVGRLVAKVGWSVLSQFEIKMGHSETAISE